MVRVLLTKICKYPHAHMRVTSQAWNVCRRLKIDIERGAKAGEMADRGWGKVNPGTYLHFSTHTVSSR